MSSSDPWDFLGVEREADVATIDRRHGALVEALGSDADADVLLRIREAYEIVRRHAEYAAPFARVAPAAATEATEASAAVAAAAAPDENESCDAGAGDAVERARTMLALARRGAAEEATAIARELVAEGRPIELLPTLAQAGLELFAARAPEQGRELAVLSLSLAAGQPGGGTPAASSRVLLAELGGLARVLPPTALADIALLALDAAIVRSARPSGTTDFAGLAKLIRSSPATVALCARHAPLPTVDDPVYVRRAKEFSAVGFALTAFVKVAQMAWAHDGCASRPEAPHRSFDELVAAGRSANEANESLARARDGEVETLLVDRLRGDGGLGCAPRMDFCLTGETASCFAASTARCEAGIALVTAIHERVDCTSARTHFAAFSVAEADVPTDATRRFDAFIGRELALYCGGDAGVR